MRRAPKVDANQSEIVTALRTQGALVTSLAGLGNGIPDLLVGHHISKRLGLVEVKDGSKPPSARAKTEDQIKFWDQWAGFPMGLVCDVESAIRFYRMLGSMSPKEVGVATQSGQMNKGTK